MEAPQPKRVSPAEIKRHELLSDIMAHARQVLLEHGVADAVAEQVAVAIADHLAQHWRGQVITIPADYHYGIAVRDEALYRQFRGDYGALARLAGMTESGVRKMVARVQQRLHARNQGRLFD
ncbi:Mor transcription activator family protein [Pigmentiphaga kullae]|uniref:Mor family transcriptional regulator n=1 Tax=Pigmentiphaga kullae TaxID=151784 RepID=A0A4Q7NLM1_9BURK|nr:Mor transcription activator family protein [Pigmentiphaga kullae]RZS86035.1 Mor family transcriptional regulator [Pigmentiphaga kullae]